MAPTAFLAIVGSDPSINQFYRAAAVEFATAAVKWLDHPTSPTVLHELDMHVRLLREDVKRDAALMALRETQWRIEQGHDLDELGSIRLADSWAEIESGTRGFRLTGRPLGQFLLETSTAP